tara:strand:- start:158 stop:442 length:285 start_codon:yes stop_codon:yes gene_type:complete
MKKTKTIAITLRFWTNDLKVEEKAKKMKACWDSGMAIMPVQEDLKVIKNKPFKCYEDIIPAIKEFFREQKIYVVSGSNRPRILSHKRKTKKEVR